MALGNHWPTVIHFENGSTIIGVDYGTEDKTTIITGIYDADGKLIVTDIIQRMGFVCDGCEAEFEPGTNSFAKLLELAKEAGWSIKWLDLGYKTWCAKCNHEH